MAPTFAQTPWRYHSMPEKKENWPYAKGPVCVKSSQNYHPVTQERINSWCLDTSHFQERSPLSNYFCFAWISRCLQTSGPKTSGEPKGPHRRILGLTTQNLSFQEFVMCEGYNWFHLRYFSENYACQFSEILALNYFIYTLSLLKYLYILLYWLQMPTLENEHMICTYDI